MPHKLKLHGVIGDWWDRNDSMAVTTEIDAIEEGEEIEVHLNSPGGDAFDGVAIFNALRQHDGPVTIYVDALAASAASLIAMAGDTVIMGLGSMIMVHNPWMLTAGDADDHRKSAEMLDKLRDSYVSAYASKTGKSAEDLRDTLSEETWMTAEEAVSEGFADEVDEEADEQAAASAMAMHDFSEFQQVPGPVRDKIAAWHSGRAAAMAAQTETQTGADEMTIEKKKKKDASASGDSQPQAAVETGPDIEKLKAEARREEQARQKEIRRACAAASLGADFADELVDATDDSGNPLSKQDAHERIFAKLQAQQEAEHEPVANASGSITGGADAKDNFVEGATQALLARAGVEKHDRQNPYNGFSLKEMARKGAELAGADLVGLDPKSIAGAGLNPQAFGGHSSSDFPKILENVAYKEMLRGWEESGETFQQWTRSGNLPDFKASKRVDLNLFDNLDEMTELGEYKHGTIGERGEEIQLATYGKKFGISRKALVNDDMSAFTTIPRKMGRAASRTIGNLAYAQLTTNPTMSDNVVLFHSSNHSNAATSAALGVDTLDAARVAMATQKDPDDKAEGGLNIRPSYLIVPVALESTARTLMESQYEPGSNNNDINVVSGMAEIISDARLDADSATTWYVTADPNVYDVVEVAYLNGVQTPTMERNNPFNIDGVEYKIRIDAGVKALDYRTLYRGQA